MPRRASDRYPDEKRPCAFCRTLRVVIMFAVFVVALLAYSDNLVWLADVQFIDIFATVIGVAFVLVLIYKTWEEYGRPKRERDEAKEERRQAMEKLFDEMDEAVAKREAEEAVAEVAVQREAESEPIEVEVLETEVIADVIDGEELVEADVANESVSKGAGNQTQPQQLDIFGFELERK